MRMLPLAGVLVGVVLLAGCVPSDPVVTPQPEPSSTPLFASEEQALAAATEAYAAYLAMSDTIFQEGGAHPERLEAFATGDNLASNLEGFEEVRAQTLRGVGHSTFDSAVLQQYSGGSAGQSGLVTIYLCEDVSQTDVVDAQGNSTVNADRPTRLKFEVVFDASQAGKLLVAGSERWPGDC